MAIWDRLTSFIAGGAVARAASEGVSPVLEPVRQHAWQRNQLKVVNPGTAAQLVTQGLIPFAEGKQEASREGINANRFDALVQLAYSVPGTAELMFLWRYNILTEKEWAAAMHKLGMRPDMIAAVAKTFSLPLDQGAIATAVHRGIMEGKGLLLREPPIKPGKVPAVPPSKLDPVAQAQAQGISHEQLRILVGNTGLPLSLGEMLQLLNRGKVTKDDVQRSIAESNLRNEYMDVALDLRRLLLTPREWAEAELRGVHPRHVAQANAEAHGLTADDYVTLFETVGRPLPVHQIVTGIARGGTYGGTYDDVPEPYRDAIRRSNIRPEYAVLAFYNRYNYPSAFVLRSLVQGGELTAEQGHTILLEIGWPPNLARLVADSWGGLGAAAADPHVKKAQTSLYTLAHKDFLDYEITDAEATEALKVAGVNPDAIPNVLTIWKAERNLPRKSLSESQIAKNFGTPPHDWTWAYNRLRQLGYTDEDTQILIGPPPPGTPPPAGGHPPGA